MNVAGLDLSLTGAGMVVIPEGWDLDWSALPRLTVGHELRADASEADKLGRLVRIRIDVLQFLAEHEADAVWVEGYAFSRRSRSAHALAELGGVVKVACLEHGYPVRVVGASAARKTFLGHCPRKDAKVATQLAVYNLGARSLSGDEVDAWVVANHGRSEMGVPAWMLGTETIAPGQQQLPGRPQPLEKSE